MHADLIHAQAEFASLKGEAAAFLAPLTPAAFNWQPGPGRWSIAECFDHLNAVGELYSKALRRATEKARAAGQTGSGPYSYTLAGRVLLWGMEPPPKLRVGAPPMVIPAPGSSHDRDAVLARFVALQDAFQADLAATDGLDLGRVRVGSPPVRRLKISILQGFQLMASHERRHFWQARQVQASTGFPAAS